MASSALKPGVPVILREAELSLEMFKQGASLRVTGKYVLETPFNIVLNI
jgi:CST complex subunit TEN1